MRKGNLQRHFGAYLGVGVFLIISIVMTAMSLGTIVDYRKAKHDGYYVVSFVNKNQKQGDEIVEIDLKDSTGAKIEMFPATKTTCEGKIFDLEMEYNKEYMATCGLSEYLAIHKVGDSSMIIGLIMMFLNTIILLISFYCIFVAWLEYRSYKIQIKRDMENFNAHLNV